MTVADAIAEFLARHVRHVFTINGGAALWMIHAIHKRKDISYVCPQSEGAAAFQADAYARLHGFGCALVTSGPGATNLITGIAASYYDSVPCLYIAGQQVRARLKGGTGVRQIGFQETEICEIVRTITKYAAEPMDKNDVIPCLEAAVATAKYARRGPVLVSICDDLQRAEL